MAVRIVDFQTLLPAQHAQAARLLRAAFAGFSNAFARSGEAESEVATFLTLAERSALAAVDGEEVVGWIGMIEAYEHAWELHPLAVEPSRQRHGVGTALVQALEAKARAAGVLTVYLGSDDEFGGTSLFGRELFPGVAGKIAGIAEAKGHPFAFYRKLGYEVVGLIPDANGPGKPDILMARKLA